MTSLDADIGIDAAVSNVRRLSSEITNRLAALSRQAELATPRTQEPAAIADPDRAAEKGALRRNINRLTEERDRLDRDRKRSAARIGDLETENARLAYSADAAIDVQMQVIQLKARISQLGESLEEERSATEYARERGARLHRELLEERRLRRTPDVRDNTLQSLRRELRERDQLISELTDRVVAAEQLRLPAQDSGHANRAS